MTARAWACAYWEKLSLLGHKSRHRKQEVEALQRSAGPTLWKMSTEAAAPVSVLQTRGASRWSVPRGVGWEPAMVHTERQGTTEAVHVP